MPIMPRFRSFLRNLFSSRRVDRDLDRELQSHFAMLVEENVTAGMAQEDAERAARMELGGAQQVKEQVRDARIGYWVQSIAGDVRYGLRQLRKNPAFSLVAIGTLSLAVGANAVVFAALNALILRPLNVPHAETLYSIHRASDNSAAQSYPNYRDLRERNHSFADLAAYSILEAGFDTGKDATRAWLFAVSGNYFDVLGIQPYLGRFFHASDEHGSNSAPYIVLSHSFWRSHFQEDRGVVGRTVLLNKHPFTIIGVAPPAFKGTLLFFSPGFFMPLVNQQQLEGTNLLEARGNRRLFMILGHLKAGVTPAQAVDDINAISSSLEKNYPNEYHHMPLVLARPTLYGDFLRRPVRAFLTALMLLAGLILLAACANLGNLFAARAADRSRELAMRLALGAAHRRVLRQLFTEALLISLAGGGIGMWGSILLLQTVRSWQPFPQFPINLPVTVDPVVYVMALLLSIASGFLFAAVPVRQVLRTDPYEIVKTGAKATAGKRMTLRDILLAAQIAICAVLVTSSMVSVRGLMRSLHSNYGFVPQDTMLVNTNLAMAGYQEDAVPQMQKRMIESLKAIPGVTSVALTDWVPLTPDTKDALVFADETTDLKPANAAGRSNIFLVSSEYFRTTKTMLLTGRTFTEHDDAGAPAVAIINQQFARKYFGTTSGIIGRYFKDRLRTRFQVVGMVADGRYESQTENPRAAMFLPILQRPSSESVMIVRAAGNPELLADAIRSRLRKLDAGLPSYIETWNKALDIVLFPSRVATVALGLLGAIGAILSITGIFGIAAYSVSQRMRELGIRIALGAQRSQVLQAALGRPFKLLAIGSVTGLLIGILASRVLAFIVYSATSRDPLVLTCVVVSMSLLGLLATWIPAQRALSVEPLILLREE